MRGRVGGARERMRGDVRWSAGSMQGRHKASIEVRDEAKCKIGRGFEDVRSVVH